MHNEKGYLNYIYYANPAIALALLGLPLYIYLPTYYAQDLKFGVLEVGVVLFLARSFDVVLDLVMGYIADRYAMQRSLIVLGAVLLIVSFYFLTHPSDDAGLFWLFGFSMLVYAGWSMLSVPYYAIGAHLGKSYHENTLYASYREVFNITGVVIALIVPYAFGVADKPAEALELMFELIAIALPFTLGIFLTKVRFLPNKEHFESFYLALKTLYTELSKSRHLFLSFFFNSFANAIPATIFLLYVEWVLGAKEYTGLLLIIYFISGVVALPFWVYLAKKFGKKKVWIASMVSASLFFSCVVFLGRGDVELFMIITILSGLSLGADMALPASMQSDIVQTKLQNSSGALFGFFAMLTKLSLAAGVGISFSLLWLVSFDPSAPTVEAVGMLSYIYALMPVLLKIVAIIFLMQYSENQNDNNQVT